MTTRSTDRLRIVDREALVWIDRRRALIMGREDYDRRTVQVLERGPVETETGFERRVVDEVVNNERVTVAGPVNARTQLERAYVSRTHRPDRLVDAEPIETGSPTRAST